MKIKKGDTIQVIAGKDKGKQGSVLRVFPELDRVVVKGINLVKRHRRPRRDGEKGERIEMEAAIHVSNVMLLCPHTSKPTRIGFKTEGDEKVRISKRAGKAL